MGLTAFISSASFAFAKTKSRCVSMSKSRVKSSVTEAASAESSSKILSISALSLISSSCRSLFAFTTASGSMKTVEPDDDISWTMPLTSVLCSALTGTTYLLFLTVIIGSCKNFL